MSAATARSAARTELRLSVFVVAALVLVAAVAGLVIGGVFHRKPAPPAKPKHPPITVAAAGVRLELPTGWARGQAAALPGFERPLWLRDARAHASAAVELLPAASPTLLPVGLHASGAPAIVEVGPGRRAWRYRVLRADPVPLVVYATPTTEGIATVGCLGSGGLADRACRALAAALTVPGTRRLEPGQSAAFLSRLSATLAGLDAARSKGARALRAARRSRAQATAADGLARAHRAAAAELTPLKSNGDTLAAATISDLGAAASAYSALADAARARAPRPYAKARRAVLRADRSLRATLARDTTAMASQQP